MDTRQQIEAVRELITLAKSRDIAIDALYSKYKDYWFDLYLDDLALVVAGEEMFDLDFYSDKLYSRITEFQSMLDLRELLMHKWLPKLEQALTNWDTSHHEIFEIIMRNKTILVSVNEEIKTVVLPLARQLPDASHWALLLQFNLVDAIELLQETIFDQAPNVSQEILHLSNGSTIISICLKVWAPTADASLLSKISLSYWATLGLDETSVLDILTAALSCSWTPEELLRRYVIIKRLIKELDSTLPRQLESALLFSLNTINALLDRSGETSQLNIPTSNVSLEQVLLDWGVDRGVDVQPDPTDRRCFHLGLGDKKVSVSLHENIFWVSDQPIDIDDLQNLL